MRKIDCVTIELNVRHRSKCLVAIYPVLLWTWNDNNLRVSFYSSAFSNFHVNTILCWLFHVRTKRFLLFGFRWVVMLRVRITICFLLRTRWRCNQRENKAENAVITLFQSITINTQTDLMTIIMIPLMRVNKSCVCYLGKIHCLSTH